MGFLSWGDDKDVVAKAQDHAVDVNALATMIKSEPYRYESIMHPLFNDPNYTKINDPIENRLNMALDVLRQNPSSPEVEAALKDAKVNYSEAFGAAKTQVLEQNAANAAIAQTQEQQEIRQQNQLVQQQRAKDLLGLLSGR